MANKKWQIRNKKLLLISYLLLLAFITACGRRGDPVAITPYKTGIDSIGVETVVIKPDAPAGLAAVYTSQSKVNTVGHPESLMSEEIRIVTKSR